MKVIVKKESCLKTIAQKTTLSLKGTSKHYLIEIYLKSQQKITCHKTRTTRRLWQIHSFSFWKVHEGISIRILTMSFTLCCRCFQIKLPFPQESPYASHISRYSIFPGPDNGHVSDGKSLAFVHTDRFTIAVWRKERSRSLNSAQEHLLWDKKMSSDVVKFCLYFCHTALLHCKGET